MALQATAESASELNPSVVCKSTPPFAVIYANTAWEALCGYTSAEMLGRSLRCLQGPATDQSAVDRLMQSVHQQEACIVPSLINCQCRSLPPLESAPQTPPVLADKARSSLRALLARADDKKRRPFSHTVSVTPLVSPNGLVEHFRATSHSVSLLHGACRGGSAVSVDLGGPQSRMLDECGGRATVDTTVSTLAAVANHERARLPSDLDWAPNMMAIEQGISPSLTPKVAPPFAPPAMVVLTSAEPPYAIMWASPGWLEVCGFTLPEIVGTDLRCIQGPATDRIAIASLMAHVRRKRGCTLRGLINYDKKRRERRPWSEREPTNRPLARAPCGSFGKHLTSPRFDSLFAGPFKHTLSIVPVSSGRANGERSKSNEAAALQGSEISMFRAESTDVSLSCGGVFEPEPAADASEQDTDDVWGDDFEDFLLSMGDFAQVIESKAAALRL